MCTLAASSNPLLTPAEAAEFLRANVRSLERWRSAGIGPPFVKIGRRCAYLRADLDAWVEQQLSVAHDRGRPAGAVRAPADS